MTDVVAGLRLALSTLTIVRVPVGRIDRAAARVSMIAAPLVGLLLGAVAAAAGYGARLLWHSGAVVAVAVVVIMCAITGLLHIDGLADTADGLGAPSGRDRLAIMASSTVGAFGAATVTLVLAVQIVALARCVDVGLGTVATVTAVTTARLSLTLGCVRGMPAARTDGLGATVAGTVAPLVALLACLATVAAVVAFAVVHDRSWHVTSRVVWSVAAGLGAAALCHLAARRRIGGITGDVLGAGVELATAAALLAFCIRP